ncbi:MAG: hypothetical protein LBS72_06105 [Oscillospiraceae bacterium]|jgi:hypothetical protein|nr:hypothetical protein [Oscillospiraceae bacterium]
MPERNPWIAALIMCALHGFAFLLAPMLAIRLNQPLVGLVWLHWVVQPIVCLIAPEETARRGVNPFACVVIWCACMIVPVFVYRSVPPMGAVALSSVFALISTSVGAQLRERKRRR